MPTKITVKLSGDAKFIALQIENGSEAVMTATEAEGLITEIATLRASAKPPAAIGPSELRKPTRPPDGMSPRTDVALLAGDLPLVALAIAFPGLGWRVAVLPQDRAAELGRTLLAHAESPPVQLQ